MARGRDCAMTFRSETERAPNPLRDTLTFVFAHWGRQRPLAGLLVLGIAAQTVAEVLSPVFAGRLIDAVASAMTDRSSGLEAALHALAVITGLSVFVLVARHFLFNGLVVFTLNMMGTIAREAFWRVQRFSTDWHANAFAGSTVRKISRGMWALDLLNDTLILALWPSVLVLAFATALFAWRWPAMGLVVAVGSLTYIAVTTALALRYVAPMARVSNRWDSRLGGALADAIGCNVVVKAFSGEQREDRRLSRVVERWKARTAATWNRSTVNGTAQNAMMLALRLAVLGLAIWLWWQGAATPGDVAYVLTTYTLVSGYLRDVGMHIRNFQRSVNDLEELVEFHGEPLGVEDRATARPITVDRGRIDFDNVTFRYPALGRHVYDRLSLTIKAGERVGLVGHSGSGKTTFVKLVQRLYDVDGGRILIDGQNVADATQESLRRQIAIVQQEPILFHRSLAENIAYSRPSASTAEIEEAARLAHAHEFIATLPMGYATLVGERGIKLSGGERQRVALARAFLADAPILILDEATSSLDSESEALVQDAMGRLMRGRTTLVIAHRLSTVRALDRILVFEGGRIVEDGRHHELLSCETSIYRRLVEQQAMGAMATLQVA
jgi:ATP-binding cassette, subfamily B, bacterial